MRLPQIHYLLVMAASILLSFLLHSSRRHIDPRSRVINFLYFFSFSVHYGAQCWMTFAVGLLLFFNLPRIWFGHVQSKLFPIFFTSGFVLSCVTMVTFIIQHENIKYYLTEQKIQIGVLSISMLASFVNSFLLSPLIVEVMIKRFSMEKESGKAYEVGVTDLTELKKDPAYFHINNRFRCLHGSCGAVNLLSLVANTYHLYYISLTSFINGS